MPVKGMNEKPRPFFREGRGFRLKQSAEPLLRRRFLFSVRSRTGRPHSGGYIVLTGRLKLYKSSPDGREQTIQLLDRSALKRLAEEASSRLDLPVPETVLQPRRRVRKRILIWLF